MIPGTLAALLAAAAAPAWPQPDRYAQLTIRQSVVVRVPALAPTPFARIQGRLRERKGPRCLPLGEIAGAAVNRPGSVDLIVRGGQRYRARFAASCPDLDYYGGFYLEPTRDGKVCADRDAVHARSGGECEIERFRRLSPGK